MVEAVLSEWPLAENASFRAGDPIATVETDKAVVDVPAESDGVLLRTLVEPGKAVTVGAPMAVLVAPGERVDDVDALIARLTGDEPPQASDEPSPAGTREVSQAGAAEVVAEKAQSDGRIFASPLARRIAKENGLAVGDIRGTGPGGRIVRDDVRRVLAERATDGSRPPADTAAAPPAETVRAVSGRMDRGGPYRDIPHSRMRRAIATRLTESSREMPVFTVRCSARVDALLAMRKELAEATDGRISLNDLIVAAAARAHVTVPEMNVIWMPDAVRQFDDVDISVAVATDNGLVTPVVRSVQRMTISSLARTTADLVGRARNGKLRQDELEGGTLTVTNLGVFGTEDFSAVINPPQAAILAVGAARPEAVVTDGELSVATVLRTTLSVDHRPVDGATAAKWMAAFVALLESPLRILA
jgi:pyruvate dehydrogenase E2 component (dihydrolipoamide acetyltransferase)